MMEAITAAMASENVKVRLAACAAMASPATRADYPPYIMSALVAMSSAAASGAGAWVAWTHVATILCKCTREEAQAAWGAMAAATPGMRASIDVCLGETSDEKLRACCGAFDDK